jgi:hypothetical protein
MISQFKINSIIRGAIFVVVSLVISSSVLAQNDSKDDPGDEYHPLLTDKFAFTLGAYRSKSAYTISANPITEPLENRDIDFGQTVGVDNDTMVFNGAFRWRFGEKWSVAGQYFSVNAKGDATLEEDVEFQDIIFREGTFVGAGIKTSIGRLFFGRTFNTGPQHEFGGGIGIHFLKINTFIEGEVIINEGETAFRRSEAETSQPLPNIGIWYMYSPSQRWLIDTRVDFMSASIDDYDGTLWNANIGVNFQVSRHFGIGLAYQYFDVELNVDKSDWQGEANFRYSGPILSLTASW